MTLPVFAEPFCDCPLTADDRRVADQLRHLIAQHAAGDATLKVIDREADKPTEVTLTPFMSDLLLDLLRHVGSGHAVTLVPICKLLTTQQAADLLNVSRPHLISLLDRGAIPHSFTGRHRRIKAEDVFGFKAQQDQARSTALAELATGDADLI